MTIINARQLAATKKKLALIEQQIVELRLQSEPSSADAISAQSLKRLANQLKEEIARYEAKSPA